MTIYNDIWLTPYEKGFSKDKYLYHFTDIDKAIKIIHGNSLKFSKTSKTNDTIESKPKIRIDKGNETDISKIIDFFSKINKQNLQLLCFTKDSKPKASSSITGIKSLTDYSGRGFALPRMWAQYAKNNTGICFIFDKAKLIKLVEDNIPNNSLIHKGNVNYVGQFGDVRIDSQKLNKLLNQINIYENSDFQTGMITADFLKTNIEFTKYNYFHKFDDWSGEREFRLLAIGDMDYYIKNIDSALAGIVIGENVEPSNEYIIKLLCQELCEIKKISFSYKGCQITSI